jgi:hypothetical protein
MTLDLFEVPRGNVSLIAPCMMEGKVGIEKTRLIGEKSLVSQKSHKL